MAETSERLALVVGTQGFVQEAAREAAPDEPALVGSYPNPFRQQATIAYDVAEESDVRLVVYDMLGRKIKTLVDERQSAGRQKATLQARSLSSGVYVFRLRIGDHMETGRLVHVR
jgi:RecA/RadA recombinase